MQVAKIEMNKTLRDTDAAVFCLVANRTEPGEYFSRVHRLMERKERVSSLGLGFGKSRILKKRINGRINGGIHEVFTRQNNSNLDTEAKVYLARKKFSGEMRLVVLIEAATIGCAFAAINKGNAAVARAALFAVNAEFFSFMIVYAGRLELKRMKYLADNGFDLIRSTRLALISVFGYLPTRKQVESVAKKLFEV